ncbi:MAG: glutamate-5-semialdehyde dehydrogenase [Bacteroidota bacterium]|nr:glutamate-5-semialdehyde dehydrogenase [Bacteroidota bacterium]
MQNLSLFKSVQKASRSLSVIDVKLINELLLSLAEMAEHNADFIISENKKDLDRMDPSNPKYDRLLLNKDRISSIAKEIRNVANLESPLGKTLESRTLPNGMNVEKITVPLGVVGIIYEARPNVTFDCFSLCLKSGNAVILKGGSDAEFSNLAIATLIKNAIRAKGLNDDIIGMLPPDREATEELLNAVGYVDVLIPRGSQGLIDYVRQNAKVPVIETGAGIVHAYFDKDGDIKKGSDIIFNSKTRRVSVCNALDCLLINKDRISDLPELTKTLADKNVIIYADEVSYGSLTGKYPQKLLEKANESHFGTEFLDYKIAIKTVDSLEDAIEHIANYSSKHSEVIISENKTACESFLKSVDAAAVYSNASTAFTDGAQFGMGAEIGISTQKLHARGPMALPELTSYKWIIRGNGQIRS